MKRIKVINYHGDGIAKTLRKLRDFYGDRWTRNMARYAISKISRLPVTYDITIKQCAKTVTSPTAQKHNKIREVL